MIDTSKSLICPSGQLGDNPIIIDLEKILEGEARQDEVATVNSVRAPELLACFTRNWLDLSALVSKLTAERNKAEKELEKRKSVILLDLMPEMLAKKGVSDNADNRKAVIALDEEYRRKSDTLDEISAILELMRGKMKSFDMAFTSTKRLVTQDTYMQYNKHNSLSGDTYTYSPPKSNNNQQQNKPTRAGFGSAKVY